MFSGSTQGQQRTRMNDQQETLVSLAADTGGKALLDNNDLSLGIVQAQNDVRSYYILGYYSTNEKTDGRYRKLQVKIGRYPQAKLDFRSGYFGAEDVRKLYLGRQRKPAAGSADAGGSDDRPAAGHRDRLFPRGPPDLLHSHCRKDPRLRAFLR